MLDPAWEQVPFERYEDYWTPFDTRFAFQPYAWREHTPAIIEPTPSLTIDLAPIFAAGQSEFAAAEHALNALALLAMTRVFAPNQRLIVLDWQHPAWWFWPHRQAVDPDCNWPIEVFPNGDYYAFLTEDMTAGTFGHPWEQTLCIFGQPLITALAPTLSSWLPVKRARHP